MKTNEQITIPELRKSFWHGMPQGFRRGWKQNQYNATIRSEWVVFVDMMARDGHISESTAQNATL
jgi:hypothetical protein